ncbi:FadR/GntR family transcriptional regulator [Paenibacillus thailandensis]|uniref:FadR/GntR family transcriptional regulator n=1 Tax=Paenibacillus thailandensis TaxID=393250 RepID=A0ABW5QXF4_9BACL
MNNDNRPLKSYEWVMRDIKTKMEDGEYEQGARLPSVEKLAVQYGVGRSTIREALGALKALGMLDIRQGGGTFVRSVRPEAESGTGSPLHPGMLQPDVWADRALPLRHLLEVRRVLETGCAALAATNRSESDLALLKERLDEMERTLGNEEASEQADVGFHRSIAAATHNPVLSELMDSLSNKLHVHMRDMRALWFYAERSTAERLLREHAAIYEAIAAGDAKAAAGKMERHIAKVEQVIFANGASG